METEERLAELGHRPAAGAPSATDGTGPLRHARTAIGASALPMNLPVIVTAEVILAR